MRARHLKECKECQKEGRGKLTDSDGLAVLLFARFMSDRDG